MMLCCRYDISGCEVRQDAACQGPHSAPVGSPLQIWAIELYSGTQQFTKYAALQLGIPAARCITIDIDSGACHPAGLHGCLPPGCRQILQDHVPCFQTHGSADLQAPGRR